jgi:glucuronate isomerase
MGDDLVKGRRMQSTISDLYAEIRKIPLVDPHSHIVPTAPAAKSLDDLLGYHYYTELAHSAGLPKNQIEGAGGLARAERLAERLADCSNTVQYSWLVELAREFFGFQDDQLTKSNIGSLFSAAEKTTAADDWPDQVFTKTNLEAIFLTNDFDDPLDGFDTKRYVPCLRTDELLFKLSEKPVRDRLERATGVAPGDWASLGKGVDRCFEHFIAKGARACAVSLPPDFEPVRPSASEAESALRHVAAGVASADETRTLAYALTFALADRCEEHRLPFDLMIGVHRRVYEAGVYQGQDLFDQRTSLYQFRKLFNEKSRVVFPISVLTSNQNQELVSYAWIFPNVVANGHWWYSNIPAYIEPDLRGRLEAAPANKQIGYYSDAYKLEFVLPKFNMYRWCLARVLASEFVVARRWSETKALELAKKVLRDNVLAIFPQR